MYCYLYNPRIKSPITSGYNLQMNTAARTARWARSTAACKKPAETRPAAEADNGVKP